MQQRHHSYVKASEMEGMLDNQIKAILGNAMIPKPSLHATCGYFCLLCTFSPPQDTPPADTFGFQLLS